MNASQIIYDKLAQFVDGKCYPLFIPKNTPNKPPYIVYQIISTEPDNSLYGITGHEWTNVQIDVYCQDYDDCLALSYQVVNELDRIKPSIYHGMQYVYDKESGLFRAIIEYGFWQTLSMN
ncbi:hypothetical protein MOMA_09261 [Moraxella macacae 0408225]|uniref:DUF3168 domain-containing protein n=1 Tax=Moraxella macacae 0408225 TaxID=1230338 RepID=L2F7J3_9GAMM|nr:hypothetical protein [Moraxella macacae]ELA08736.1 hypothetical protein MOMA_09261 [Moraxella macacae 0408225]